MSEPIAVTLETDIDTLRAMVAAADLALRYWPGGDPEEQVMLERMKRELYAILMTILLEHEII